MLRDLCPALANKTYFNYGGQGPLPAPSLEAITASWQRIQELGPFPNNGLAYVASSLIVWRSQRMSLVAAYCHSGAFLSAKAIGC